MTEATNGFKETEIGPIPVGWEVVQISDMAEITGGGTPSTKKPHFWNGAIPFLTPSDVTSHRTLHISRSSRYITKEGLRQSSAKLMPPGSVLMTSRATIGEVAICDVPMATNQGFINIIVRPDELANEFLAYWITWQKEFLKELGTGTTFKEISKGVFRTVRIPLPPLPEQRRIAHVLSTIQRAIAAQDALIAAAREVKRSLMQRLFTYGPGPEPTPTKETEIGEIPEHWDIGILNELCDKIVDCPHSTPKYSSSGVLVVRNFNIRDGRLKLDPASYTSEEEYRERIKRAVPQEGDVLFSREAPIGEACLVPSRTRLCLGQRTMLLRSDPARLNNAFLVYTFYSENIRRIMLSKATGVTAKHLNVGDVRRLQVPLPPISEQQGIAHMLLAADRKIEAEEQRKAALEALFKTMLHQLMTGQLRLPH